MSDPLIDGALFLTGGLRSGTTLLANLMSAQEQVSVLSQPFPLLFIETKRALLRARGSDDPYPLGHLFLDHRDGDAGLAAFLRRWRTSSGELRALFETMRGYSGQTTRFDAARLENAFASIGPHDDFAAVVATLDRRLAHASDSRWCGSKEVVCEEFLPYLLERGFRCVLIVRDLRDVLASSNHGKGRDFGGDLKPTLFNIRSWRKSVSFALALEDHPRFAWCRYEDLVADPAGTLARLHTTLGLGTFDEARVHEDLRDSNGQPWRGNSSWDERSRVTASSVGVHRQTLLAGVSRFAEAAALPELQCLGYETSMTRAEAVNVIAAFEEPYVTRTHGFERDLMSGENAAIEMQRLQRVSESADDDTSRWFLFREAHSRLRATFGG